MGLKAEKRKKNSCQEGGGGGKGATANEQGIRNHTILLTMRRLPIESSVVLEHTATRDPKSGSRFKHERFHDHGPAVKTNANRSQRPRDAVIAWRHSGGKKIPYEVRQEPGGKKSIL